MLHRVEGNSEDAGRYSPQTRRHADLVDFICEAWTDRSVPVLDVGCGAGLLARRLKDAGFSQVSGTDWMSADAVPDRDALVDYRRIDLNEDSLERHFDRQFPVIVSSDVLEHLERPAAVLRSMARLLAPNGRLYVTLPNVGNIVQRLCWLVTGNSNRYRTERPGEYGHISLFPTHVLKTLLNRAALTMVREGRGYAALGGYITVPGLKFGPWLSYARYYEIGHQRDR